VRGREAQLIDVHHLCRPSSVIAHGAWARVWIDPGQSRSFATTHLRRTDAAALEPSAQSKKRLHTSLDHSSGPQKQTLAGPGALPRRSYGCTSDGAAARGRPPAPGRAPKRRFNMPRTMWATSVGPSSLSQEPSGSARAIAGLLAPSGRCTVGVQSATPANAAHNKKKGKPTSPVPTQVGRRRRSPATCAGVYGSAAESGAIAPTAPADFVPCRRMYARRRTKLEALAPEYRSAYAVTHFGVLTRVDSHLRHCAVHLERG